MDWQQATALGIVGLALFLMIRQFLQRRRLPFERDNHCGCSATGTGARGSSILIQGRKGEVPTVVVKAR